MPKLPQVFAAGDVGTAQAPRMPLPPAQDVSGFTTFAHSIQDVAQSYAYAERVAAREAARVAKQAATLEAENALNEAQRQVADQTIAIGLDPNVTPQKYSQAVDDAIRATRQGMEKTLTSPDSRYMFQKAYGNFARAKSIEGKFEGVERGKSAVVSMTGLANREDINLAINAADGPPENPNQHRDAAVARLTERTQKLVATKTITGEQAKEMITQGYSDIAEGRVVKSWTDPKTRLISEHQLRNGMVPELTVQKQRQLLHELQTKEREERAQQRAEEKEFREKMSNDAEKIITDLVYQRQFGPARQILEFYGKQYFTGGRYEHWSDTILTREGKTGPSDPATKMQAQLDTYSVVNDPVVVKAYVDDKYRTGFLDDGDHKTYVSHLVARINAKAAGDPALQRRHAQVEQNLREQFRLTGPGAQELNMNAQAVFSLAQEDLARNSSYFAKPGQKGNNEDPFDWEARRKAFYIAQVSGAVTPRVNTLRMQIRDGNGVRFTVSEDSKADMQALVSRRGTFKTDADFEDQIRNLMEYHNLKGEQRRLKAIETGQLQTTPTPGTPSTPAAPAPAPKSEAQPAAGPKTYQRPEPPPKKE